MHQLILFLATVLTYNGCYSFPLAGMALPEERMNISEIIAYQGYPHEVHDVTTDDGYILHVVRIPHGKHNQKQKPKGVVFLQHGLLDSGVTWLMNSAEQSLGFILADAGYDVWIGNSRGNTYSRKHIKWTDDDDEFWNFSFDEMAKYDVPACVEYVTKRTGAEKIHYAGHSQGTLTAFVAFGLRPDIGEKIHTFYALAPVARVSHIEGAFKFMANFDEELELIFSLFGVKEFMPQESVIVGAIADLVCTAAKSLCSNFIFLMAGSDVKEFNSTRIPVISAHTPAGTSVKNIVHWSQMVDSDKFQMYDYGSKAKNMKHYGLESAPEYKLSDMQTPTMLFSGGNDWLADPTDVAWMVPQIPDLVAHRNVSYYNHLDFVWGLNANELIYPMMLKDMAQHADPHHEPMVISNDGH